MTEPSDEEIIAVMRDGYNCRYNDEADHVDFARAVLARWGQPAHSGEPVAWQSRTRPTWGGNDRPWSPWKPCTKEQAEDCWKTRLLNGWAYQARALYTAPQPTPAPLSDDLRDRLVAISEAIADQDDRAAQAMLREILEAPQQEARPVTPYTCPKCHALWLHWPAEQSGFGMDTLNCRSTTHCDYCEKGGVEQLERLERVPAALKAPQQEAQEPVGYTHASWIAEAKRGGGGSFVGRKNAAFDVPIYTAPQPSPTPQADSVTAPAAGAVAHTISDAQIEAMPVWRNFVGLWPESRREIVDAVVDLLTTPPTQAADSVLEDAARLDWLLLHISGAEFRRIGVHYSGNASRADVDAARKQGENHD